jgi:hypothetical protein
LRNDDTLPLVADGPGETVDDGRHSGQHKDVVVADTFTRLEIGVEERGKGLPEPRGPLWASAIGEVMNGIDYNLDGK